MKMKRKLLFYGAASLAASLLIGGITVLNFNLKEEAQPSLSYDSVCYTYAFDTTNCSALTGFGDNVFVAEVVKEEGTYYENMTGAPDTIYRVKVLKNIKGELSTSKTVKLYKHGGVDEEGLVFRSEDDVELEAGGHYLVVTANQGAQTEEGKAHLTMPDGSILVIGGGVIPLGKDEEGALNSSEVKDFAESLSHPEQESRVRYAFKDSEAYFKN